MGKEKKKQFVDVINERIAVNQQKYVDDGFLERTLDILIKLYAIKEKVLIDTKNREVLVNDNIPK